MKVSCCSGWSAVSTWSISHTGHNLIQLLLVLRYISQGPNYLIGDWGQGPTSRRILSWGNRGIWIISKTIVVMLSITYFILYKLFSIWYCYGYHVQCKKNNQLFVLFFIFRRIFLKNRGKVSFLGRGMRPYFGPRNEMRVT